MRTNGTPQEISKYASAHRRRKKWLTGITCLAAVVVFCTTYALILPAITLEADRTLACSYEVHEHDASCYDHENHLICGLADYVVHTHDENCYNADGNLVCTLEEIQPHEHTAECYKEESVLICNLEEGDDAHEHTSDCYETQSVLNCDKPEAILHTHTEDCYNEDENLICGLLQTEEHIHEDDCLEPSHDEKTDEDSSALQPVETTEGNGSALLSSGETEENDSAKLPSGETEEVQMDKDSKKNAPAPLSDGDGEAGDNGEENDGENHPSEEISGLYLSALSISDTQTGTAPFDGDDNEGNDSSIDNNIIRTFDTITYNLSASVNDTTGDKHESVKIYLEVTLDKDMTKAMFNTDLFKYLDGYTITYYDSDGKELASGINGLPDYSANKNASGSMADEPYRTNVTQQVLTGYVTVSQENGDEFASLTKTIQAGIDVKASCNGDVIQPIFRCWVEKEDASAGEKTVTSQEIKVSAAANYNVALTRSTTLAYESSFDLSTGEEATSSTADGNKVSGLMLAYCVTLQLYNDASADKGLKGIELPKGEISADISFEESAVSTNGDKLDFSKNFTPILWDYRTDGNATNESKKQGAWGRNLYWGGIENTARAHWAAPGNNLGSTAGSCYNGGTWSMSSDYKDGWESGSGTESGPYTMTVSNYDFDLDSFIFPDRTQGTTTVVYTDNIGCFSAGYLEVLLQYDNDQIDRVENSTSIYMAATMDNFKATSMSSETENNITTEMIPLKPENGKKTDNYLNSAITVKNPGTIDKVNSIASRAVTGDIATGYMGIAGTYWTGECGDPAAFAGSEVWLAGQFYLSSDAGLTITDFNYLQIFDSAGFSITGAPQVSKIRNITIPDGTTTFLYAADPDYPGGYDSNAGEAYLNDEDKRVAPASHMYKIKESDLIYFDSLEELENNGYTCVGVMLEARGIEMKPYGWAGLTVPVKVTDDPELVGKTLCTINRVSAWTDNKASDLTWKGATTAEIAKQVSQSEIYQSPQYRLDTENVIHSNKKKSQYDYKKTEYENGNIVTGTHLNGKYGGMSVLILGYKASLKLNVEDKKTGAYSDTYGYYDLDKRERTANYKISNIQTTLDSANNNVTSTGDVLTTNLTITLSLDKALTLQLDTLKMDEKQISVENDAAELTYTAQVMVDGENVEKPVTYTVYYEYDENSGNYIIHINGVPVGVSLPDIVFSTDIGKIGSPNDVVHQQKMDVMARITGTSDRRAYSENAGNQRSVTIEVNRLTSTSLVKAVDKSYAELNDTFTYSLNYTNNGSTAMTNTLYLYDIMPYDGDSQGSLYEDSSANGQVGITSISAVTSGSNAKSGVQARLYYSMVEGELLSNIIEFRNMPDDDTTGLYLRQLLGNALVDGEGNVYFFQRNDVNIDLYEYDTEGQIIKRNFALDDKGYINSEPAGGYNLVKADNISINPDDNTVIVTGDSAQFKAGTYQKLFRYLGDLTSGGTLDSGNNASTTKEAFTHATCIFAVARNLAANETVSIQVAVETNGNRAGDYYVNSAHSWISGTSGEAELDSNTVETRIVSRKISGVVWYDSNLNGVHDAGEAPVSGVGCTLFVKNKEGTYVPCEKDVTGGEIKDVTTGLDGAYSFDKLAYGDYIVAFKSDGLSNYTGATTYQINKGNDTVTNDGVALIETDSGLDTKVSIEGINSGEYSYAIAYSLSGSNSGNGSTNTVEFMKLHGLDEIRNYLNSEHIELYDHQDLGLVIAGYELPNTGGTGTTKFIIGGLLLMAGAAGCGYRLRRRRERRVRY